MKLSPLANRILTAFAFIVLGGAILAMKFARHPIVWLVALTASIPLFAAIAGAIFADTDNGQNED